jgi:hypothetical protein
VLLLLTIKVPGLLHTLLSGRSTRPGAVSSPAIC